MRTKKRMIMKLLVMLLLVTGMGILGNPVSVSAKSVPKLNVTKKTVIECQSLKLKVKKGSVIKSTMLLLWPLHPGRSSTYTVHGEMESG